MPSRSHGRCKVCRAITHINSRFGLCAVHMRQRNKRIEQERQDAKTRRRRALTIPVLEEDQDMAEAAAPDKPGRRPRHSLTEDEQVQILDAYTTTSESVKDISARFGIGETYIYNVLDRVGVSWRRGNPESFATWQANQHPEDVVIEGEDSIPGPQQQALENMLKLPNSSGTPSPYPTVLPPKPEPVAPTPAVERRVPASNRLQMFEVTVTGTYTVSAMDIMQAMQRVMSDQPNLRITGIRELD